MNTLNITLGPNQIVCGVPKLELYKVITDIIVPIKNIHFKNQKLNFDQQHVEIRTRSLIQHGFRVDNDNTIVPAGIVIKPTVSTRSNSFHWYMMVHKKYNPDFPPFTFWLRGDEINGIVLEKV